METRDADGKTETRDDAIVEALVAPGEASFLDALLAVADETANGDGARAAPTKGLQAALARKMRETLTQEDDSRDAA